MSDVIDHLRWSPRFPTKTEGEDIMRAMTAQDAITRSVSHTEIVTLDHDADVARDLRAVCDDSVQGNTTTEYWGVDAQGHAWRVHMHHQGK